MMESGSERDFFEGVRQNDLSRVRSLLEADSSLVNARILGDATLLNEQVWENKTKVSVGPDESRDTPALHYSVFHGHVEMARLLVENGADVEALGFENNHGMTPSIVLAAWEGGVAVLRLLLEHGADPNAISSTGVSPLLTANRHGKTDHVELLQQYGAIASS